MCINNTLSYLKYYTDMKLSLLSIGNKVKEIFNAFVVEFFSHL